MDEQLRELIINKLDLDGLSEEDTNEVITTLGGLILERIVLKVTEDLSDEKVIVFEEIISGGDQTKLIEFLSENVDNLDEYIEASSKEIIEEYKQL